MDDAREWDFDLLRLRRAVEERFLDTLRAKLAPLLVEPVDLSGSLSQRLETGGEVRHLRE
ncbi:hypothetical protein ACGFYE_38075 [Streptomyces zaomyceticus]|uniref:hypothetical protein n=1 Tax=Streptomyces zaomyceticus TaxID=68286 RepID=UPI003714700D